MNRASLPLRGFDQECRAVVADNLQRRGIELLFECTPTRIEPGPQGTLLLHYVDAHGNEKVKSASQVMFATGRKPSTKGLGLEDAGVQLDDNSGAILVDAYSRSNVPSIWAIGDVTNRMNLTPVAIMEGKAFASTAFGGKPVVPEYDNVRVYT